MKRFIKRGIHKIFLIMACAALLFGVHLGYAIITSNLDVDGNTKLKKGQIQISLDSNGGSTTVNNLYYKSTDTFSNLPLASKDHSEFLGWYTNKTNGEEITSSTNIPSEDTTIYARYQTVTAPVISGGSSTWVNSNQIIKISTVGSANSGVKNYEYYITSNSVSPTSTTEATGTTSGTITISSEGISNIYYRTVSNSGIKSEWSNLQTVKKESYITTPVITGGNQTAYNGWVSSTNIDVTTASTAGSGIAYYEYFISRSSTVPTTSSIPTGTTSKVLAINANMPFYGPMYIWYRGVSNNGMKSSWSNNQYVKLDPFLFTPSLSIPFSYSGSNTTLLLGYFSSVDITKSYHEHITIKSSNPSTYYHIGFVEFDVDYLPITVQNVIYCIGSTTYLTRDLKPGDTVVYLASTSGFNSTTTLFYQLGFIIWNYKDSTGYTYPKETYSRNVYFDLYNNTGINKSNNTITLKSAWTGQTIPAGTYLSQSDSSGTYNYGVYYGNLTTNYQTFTNNISGINPWSFGSFRPATKYIKPLILIGDTSSRTVSVSSYGFSQIS